MGRDNLGCSPPCDEPGPAAQKSAYWTSDSSVSMDLPEDLRNPGLRLETGGTLEVRDLDVLISYSC